MTHPYRLKPFPRQTAAAKLIYRKKRVGLFWEMGCGKTKAVLDFLDVMFFHKRISQALVICKLRGIPTWEDEILKNMQPSITYHILRPGPVRVGWEKVKIIIVNYEYARSCLPTLLKLAPDVVAIDEGHRIKNPHARQSRMAHKLGKVCTYAIDMTGTFIGNHPLDIWSQFKFIKPDLLEPTFKEFKQEHVIYSGFGGFEIKKYRNIKELAKRISPYVSIQKKDIAVEKTFIEVSVELPSNAKKHYTEMENDFVTFVTKEEAVSAPIVLAKMMKLSQISGGHIHSTETGDDFPLHRAKLEAMQDLTDSLLDQGEKRVVIFARFIWELNEIKKLLAPDWVTYTIKGGVTVKEQKLAEQMFKETGGAMLCQIDSGSESMNLQSCAYTIYYSLNYSAISFQQSQDRTHREGQKGSACFYYLLLAKGTLDRRIYRILKGKKNVADEVKSLIQDAKEKHVIC